MDAYDNFGACTRLTGFVDALSNWYVRRSRDRFWSSEKIGDSADKRDAYWTLYECLLTTCKLIAPFVPFLAEAMWQNLAVAAQLSLQASRLHDSSAGTAAPQSAESVHLCDYPAGDPAVVDEELSARMALVPRDRLAGPQCADGREAQGAPAARAGRGRAGRPHPPGVARRARLADLRRVERQAGRVHRKGRAIHHLHRAARPEAAWPAAGKAAAGLAKAAGREPTAAACSTSCRAREASPSRWPTGR